MLVYYRIFYVLFFENFYTSLWKYGNEQNQLVEEKKNISFAYELVQCIIIYYWMDCLNITGKKESTT